MTTLITGGMGFIGLHTARRFLDAGENVVLTQFRARREPDFIKNDLGHGAQVESLDVQDGAALNAIVAKHRVDSIVHLAVPGLNALTPQDEYRTNTNGLYNVMTAGLIEGVGRVTVASSVGVYSGLPNGPFKETDRLPLESTNPTEAYKKAEETLGHFFARRTGQDLVFARIGTIYGPLYHSMNNLPSRLCHAAVRGEQPDLEGRYGRGLPYEDDENDLCYVKDAAAGIYLLHTAKDLNQRSYNISSGRVTTNGQLVRAVNGTIPTANIAISPGKGPNYRAERYADISSARRDLGYEPVYDVQSGIDDYLTWLGTNPQ